MERINVGLIGYGLAGAVFHAPLIVSEPRLRLKSVVTSRVEQLARELPGVQAVAQPELIFRDPEIQLVVIASPNQTHFPLARQALDAGKHVVVDKPFTITLAEADELLALAARKGLIVSVFHNRRWDGDFKTVRQLLQEGSLGTLATFESRWDRFRPTVKKGWREETAPGSGLFYDLAPHLIDQALTLFGLPQAVFADITHLRAEAQTDDYFHLVLEYETLRVTLHSSTLAYHPGARFTLHGDAGSFFKFGLDEQEGQLRARMRPGMPDWGQATPGSEGALYLVDGTQRTIPTLPGNSETYYAATADALFTGSPPPVTAQEARDVMLVLGAGLRSAYEQRTVRLRE